MNWNRWPWWWLWLTFWRRRLLAGETERDGAQGMAERRGPSMTDEELWELRCIRRRVGCIMICLLLPVLLPFALIVAWIAGLVAAALP